MRVSVEKAIIKQLKEVSLRTLTSKDFPIQTSCFQSFILTNFNPRHILQSENSRGSITPVDTGNVYPIVGTKIAAKSISITSFTKIINLFPEYTATLLIDTQPISSSPPIRMILKVACNPLKYL